MPQANHRSPVSAVSAAAFLALLALSGVAGAQTQKMRPGLWEHAVSFKSQSGQMEAAMAQMQKSLAGMPPARAYFTGLIAPQSAASHLPDWAMSICSGLPLDTVLTLNWPT